MRERDVRERTENAERIPALSVKGQKINRIAIYRRYR
jgi:hypothetical protein